MSNLLDQKLGESLPVLRLALEPLLLFLPFLAETLTAWLPLQSGRVSSYL